MPENSNQSKLSNYSINFDGSTDYIEISDNILSGLSNFSISVWYNTDTLSGDRAILGAWSSGVTQMLLYWDDPDGWRFLMNNGTSSTSVIWGTGITINEWNHIAITYDGSTISFYHDNGTPVTQAATGSVNTSASAWRIGVDTSSTRYWDGKLSQFCLFNYALSTDQITYLYNLNNPMAITGVKPVLYYKLGDDSNPEREEGYPNLAVGDQVFYLNGSNNYFQFSETDYLGSGSVSWSIWERPATFTSNNYGYFFAGANQAQGGIAMSEGGTGGSHFAGQVYYYDGSTVHYLGQALTANVWNHVVLVFEEGTGSIKMYKNGSLVSTTTGIPEPYDATFNTIGRYPDANTHYLKGEISNFSAFDSALSLSQVQTLYNNGVPGDISSLSPKSWWKFDGVQDTFDGSNWTIKDYGSAAVDATSYNMTSTSLIAGDLSNNTPYSNYSIKFNGTDQWFSDGDTSGIFNGATSLSISGWMNIDPSETTSILTSNWLSSPNYQYLVRWSSSAGGFQFYLNFSSGTLTKFAQATIAVASNTWYHIVGTWDGSNMRIYVNGVFYSPGTAASATISSVTTDNLIGKYSTSVYADGKNSNIAFWKNTTLTQSEITEIYNAGVPTDLSTFSGTAPTRWYPMDQRSTYFNGSTLTIRDTINNNDMLGYNNVQSSIEGNAPGSSANGTGNNLSISDLKGDMSGSTKNSYSINMADYGNPNSQGVTPANSGRTTSVPG